MILRNLLNAGRWNSRCTYGAVVTSWKAAERYEREDGQNSTGDGRVFAAGASDRPGRDGNRSRDGDSHLAADAEECAPKRGRAQLVGSVVGSQASRRGRLHRI